MAKKVDLYKILIADGVVKLRVPPQLVGAESANPDTIQADLHNQDIDYYLPDRLLEITEKASGKFELLCKENETDFTLQVEITADEHEAYLNIVPPGLEGEALDVEKVLQKLEEHEVTHGIQKQAILNMIQTEEYYEPTLVAQGSSPKDGRDGYAELLFLKKENRPAQGSQIDLGEMRLSQPVKKGQALLRLIPHTNGKDGVSVLGTLKYSNSGKVYRVRPGRGTAYDEGRKHIIATKDGVLCYMAGTLSVEEVKVIPRVDARTGHVRFDGILQVQGNILDRFSVEAIQIDVGGSVGRSKLRSRGSIRIAQGMNGAVVHAGENLRVHSISDSQVTAGGHILVEDSITNSSISAGETLQVLSPKGTVSGGNLQASQLMRFANVGKAENSPATTLDVGISISTRKNYRAVETNLKKNFGDFNEMRDTLVTLSEEMEKDGQLSGGEEEQFDTLTEDIRKRVISIFADVKKLKAMNTTTENNEQCNGGLIFVTGKIYPGTVINIKRTPFKVFSENAAVAFLFANNGIKVQPLVSFKLTKQGLNELKNENLPRELTEGLMPLLSEAPMGRAPFFKFLIEGIGEEMAKKYRKEILAHLHTLNVQSEYQHFFIRMPR